MLMDRFEDALNVRAINSSIVGNDGYAYKAGYLLSFVREFVSTNPKLEKRIEETVKYLETLNSFEPITHTETDLINGL